VVRRFKIGVIFLVDEGEEAAKAIARKHERGGWQLVRKLPWSKGRTIYWLKMEKP
jgi:hypothetical protein